MELPTDADWIIMQCMPECGPRRKRRGRCECTVKQEQQRVLEALPADDRAWVKAHLRLAAT